MTWQDKISIAGMVISIIGLFISVFIIMIQGWFYLRNQKKFFMIEKINSYDETFLREAGLWDPTTKRLELYHDTQQELSYYNTNYKAVKRKFLIMQTKKAIANLNILNIKFYDQEWIVEGKNDLIFIQTFNRSDLGCGVYWSYKLVNNEKGERISVFFRLDNMSFEIQGNNDLLQNQLEKEQPIIQYAKGDQNINEVLNKIINDQTPTQKRNIESIFKIKLEKTK